MSKQAIEAGRKKLLSLVLSLQTDCSFFCKKKKKKTSFERVHFRMTPLELDSSHIWKFFYHQFFYSPDTSWKLLTCFCHTTYGSEACRIGFHLSCFGIWKTTVTGSSTYSKLLSGQTSMTRQLIYMAAHATGAKSVISSQYLSRQQ